MKTLSLLLISFALVSCNVTPGTLPHQTYIAEKNGAMIYIYNSASSTSTGDSLIFMAADGTPICNIPTAEISTSISARR